jgi:hypothetical protein
VSAAQAIVQGSVANIGSPAQMAYDGRAALWGSPRAAAAASPAAPPSIQPPLSVVQQNSSDGALLLTAGAYSLLYSKDAVFLKVHPYLTLFGPHPLDFNPEICRYSYPALTVHPMQSSCRLFIARATNACLSSISSL